jgi:hypothetical protein
MNEDIHNLVETLESQKGKYLFIHIFGQALDKKEGMGGFLRDISMVESVLKLDFSREDSLLVIQIFGIKSGYELGAELKIYAESVEVLWNFTPNEYRKVGEASTWKLLRKGVSDNCDIVESKKFTYWNSYTETKEIITQEPAMRIRFRP